MPFDQNNNGGGSRREFTEMARVLYFLRGAEKEGLMFNSYTATEAFEGACFLSGFEPKTTRLFIDETGK